MIEAVELTKTYGEINAVRNLSFRVEPGQVVGLLGLNGAGKTTTMRMLTTFLPPTSGTARVAGFDIVKQADSVRRSIGYLPETPPLYPELRIAEYLSFVARIKGIAPKSVAARVSDTVERCGLNSVAHRLCGQLSKGYRQRVGLAQAIIHSPAVIILDEPTSGLDPAQIIEIRQLIAGLAKDHTVILSTHILQEVTQTCSQVVIISGGKLVVQGALADLTRERSLEQRFLEAVAGDPDAVSSTNTKVRVASSLCP